MNWFKYNWKAVYACLKLENEEKDFFFFYDDLYPVALKGT